MSKPHYVIIGNGTAGNCAAKGLREGNPDIDISIISSEPTHYLKRHLLAPFLRKDQSIESLELHKPDWYEKRDIRLRINQPVVRVDPKDKSVLLAHRERVRYDKLLICSGATHRVPEYLSHFSKMLTFFCNGIEALRLKARINDIEHLTFLGGDCVALQLAASLLPMGKKLAMIMDEYRFWPLEFNEDTKEKLANAMAKKGIEVVYGDHVTEIAETGGKIEIKTMGGKIIKTGAAVLTSGMKPSLEFLEASGIDVQEGVLVNEKLESSFDDVWAAGECAQIYYPELKDYRCSTGYRNAEAQGEMAAKNMLGGSETAKLLEPGKVLIDGQEFISYSWRGFSLDETD